jgi:hypothetical protein
MPNIRFHEIPSRPVGKQMFYADWRIDMTELTAVFCTQFAKVRNKTKFLCPAVKHNSTYVLFVACDNTVIIGMLTQDVCVLLSPVILRILPPSCNFSSNGHEEGEGGSLTPVQHNWLQSTNKMETKGTMANFPPCITWSKACARGTSLSKSITSENTRRYARRSSPEMTTRALGGALRLWSRQNL